MGIEARKDFCSHPNNEQKENLERCNVEKHPSKTKTIKYGFQMNKSLEDTSLADARYQKQNMQIHLDKVQKLTPKNHN